MRAQYLKRKPSIVFPKSICPTKWLQPYTDETLEFWGKSGIESVDMFYPAFSADGLETVKVIAEENKEVFLEAGGKQYRYISVLNENTVHIEMMKNLVIPYL